MVMKKNISINISGIIFHIEEDGYKKLKAYLDSINKYFSSYDGSEEIIADIESRIAEIFLEKLDEEGKQVISNDDIDQLISTMGKVSDFEAMEEEADFSAGSSDNNSEDPKKTTGYTYENTYKARKLYRDLNDQIVGGVSSGVAKYFNIDPLWIRIAFVLSFFAGFGLIVYIIMWIVIPGSTELKDDDSIKKFYRDPDDRVLGGVAAGLANYFKTDTIIFRIIFIVLFFGFGTGLLAYIVLWIIAPQAKSLTDKMQMKGEKVTLSNIDNNIKKNKEEDLNPKGEGLFTKVILFPFRLIGRIFRALGSALAPLLLFIAAAFRIFIGAIISFTGLAIMFSILVVTGVLLGLHEGDWFLWPDSDIPFYLFNNTVSEAGILFTFAAVFIPFLYVFIAGITIIAKRKVMSSSVGWSILGIWMISVIAAFATVSTIVKDFREEGYADSTEVLEVKGDTITLSLKTVERMERRRNREYRNNSWEGKFTDLDLRASRDNTWRLEKRATARGRNTEEADRNAEQINYNYSLTDGRIVFDGQLSLPENAQFRFQDIDLTLYIPTNQPFKVDQGMSKLLHYFSFRYNWWEIYRNTWIFDEDGTLQCVTCNEDNTEVNSRAGFNDTKNFDLSSFSDISISSSIALSLEYSNTHGVRIEGNEAHFDQLALRVNGSRLEVSEVRSTSNWGTTRLIIQTPEINNLTLSGEANVNLGLQNFEDLAIVLSQQARLNLSGELNTLSLILKDEARVDSQAKIQRANIAVSDNARLYAYDGRIEECDISTNGEARARLTVTEYLTVEAGGFSSIRYKGSPRLDIQDKANSAIVSQY
tara:strand:+ start:52822 stop:55269 length:2448 start_codon:yes stop_codon:yes gene_type:complete